MNYQPEYYVVVRLERTTIGQLGHLVGQALNLFPTRELLLRQDNQKVEIPNCIFFPVKGGYEGRVRGNGVIWLTVLDVIRNPAARCTPSPISLRSTEDAWRSFDQTRASEIADAIKKCADALHPIPEEWLIELQELITRNQPAPLTGPTPDTIQ